MRKVNRFSLEERYGYQNRKVIYDKDADNDIEINNIYPIIELLNKNNEQIAELKKQLKTQPAEIVEKIKETAILDVEEYSIEPNLYKITAEELDTILKEYQK